jgi:hypothetical protein
MKREHPSPDMTLPISFEIYQQLVSASVKSGFSQEIWEIGAAAIRLTERLCECGWRSQAQCMEGGVGAVAQ